MWTMCRNFNEKKIAASHLSVIHNTTKEFLIGLKPDDNELKPEYLCDLCNETFTNENYLQSHIKTFHESTNLSCNRFKEPYHGNSHSKEIDV